MSNQSTMVVATKYRLTRPDSITKGTWKKTDKEKIHTKIVKRSYVEDRNSHNNNELYIIDDAATEKMLAKREANINAKSGQPAKVVELNNDVITHTLTKEDVEKNPELKDNGLKVGDKVQLDKDGNAIIKS